MPKNQTNRALARTIGLAALLGLAGCSFVVESRDRQCERDADCSAEGAVCDVAAGVCVASSTGSAGCVGPDGCFACAPTTQVEFLESCTDAACIPYDNAQLEGLLEEDGSLPAVP